MDLGPVVGACSADRFEVCPEHNIRERLTGTDLSQSQLLDVFQKIIDGLPEQIALVDRDWTILAVNRAWTCTAKAYGYSLGPGDNYLNFCEEKEIDGNKPAGIAAAGIRAMDGSGDPSFRCVYPGHGGGTGRYFQLCISRLEIDGRSYATITRYDVTELVNLRHLREDFASNLIAAQDQERRRIAQEVHDSTMQLLVSLGLSLGQLKRTMRSKAGAEIANEMEEVLGEAQRELRTISYLAYPPQLEEFGLAAALKQLAGGFARRTKLAIDVHTDEPVTASPAIQAAIYRTAQEALSNSHRHAHATRVAVGLYGRRSCIHLVIADNGAGMPEDLRRGVGLSSMRARVKELGGKFRIRSGHPGTVVMASFPLHADLRAVGDMALPVGTMKLDVLPFHFGLNRPNISVAGWQERRAS